MLLLPGVNSRIKEVINTFCQGKELMLSKKINISQPRINRLFNVDKRSGKYPLPTYEILSAILNTFRNVDAEWLISGRGEMLVGSERIGNIISEAPAEYLKGRSIPFFRMSDFESLTGLLYEERVEASERMFIPGVPRCDGAVVLSGSVGNFGFSAGDIIMYRALTVNENNIFYGGRYLISVDMGGVDYLYAGYVFGTECHSRIRLSVTSTQKYAKEIEVDRINALALIVGVVQFNHLY